MQVLEPFRGRQTVEGRILPEEVGLGRRASSTVQHWAADPALYSALYPLRGAVEAVLQGGGLLGQERLGLVQALWHLHLHGPPEDQHALFLSLSPPLELALPTAHPDQYVSQWDSPAAKEVVYAVQALALVWKNYPAIPSQSLQRVLPVVSTLLHTWEHWALPQQQQHLPEEVRRRWGEQESGGKGWMEVREWAWKVWEAALHAPALGPLPWAPWFRQSLPLWSRFPEEHPVVPGSPPLLSLQGVKDVLKRGFSPLFRHASLDILKELKADLSTYLRWVGWKIDREWERSQLPGSQSTEEEIREDRIRRNASRQLLTWWRGLLDPTTEGQSPPPWEVVEWVAGNLGQEIILTLTAALRWPDSPTLTKAAALIETLASPPAPKGPSSGTERGPGPAQEAMVQAGLQWWVGGVVEGLRGGGGEGGESLNRCLAALLLAAPPSLPLPAPLRHLLDSMPSRTPPTPSSISTNPRTNPRTHLSSADLKDFRTALRRLWDPHPTAPPPPSVPRPKISPPDWWTSDLSLEQLWD